MSIRPGSARRRRSRRSGGPSPAAPPALGIQIHLTHRGDYAVRFMASSDQPGR